MCISKYESKPLTLLNHTHKWKRGPVRFQQIAQKANRSGQSFVQTQRPIGNPCFATELIVYQETGKGKCSIPILGFASLPEHDEEAVSIAGHSVTNSRSFAQQSLAPDEISG